MSEWISVEDELPLQPNTGRFKSIECLVSDGIDVCLCDFQSGSQPKPWTNWSDYSNISANKITHWMPKPNPPKDSENEQA